MVFLDGTNRRRVLRIFPAYYAFLLVMTLFSIEGIQRITLHQADG